MDLSNYKQSQYAKRILALSFLATLPRLSDGGTALTRVEAARILDEVVKNLPHPDGPRAASFDRLLDLLGIDKKVREDLERELNGKTCRQLLAKGNAFVATQTAVDRMIAADNYAQGLAKDTWLKGKALSEQQLLAATAAVAAGKMAMPSLSISQTGLFGPNVSSQIDQTELYNLFDMQARAHAAAKVLKTADIKVQLTFFARRANDVTFHFTLERPGSQLVTVNVFHLPLEGGESAEEAVARTLMAATQYADQLEAPVKLSQEINALRFDMMKMFRVAEENDKPTLQHAILLLAGAGDQGFFEREATYRGRLFSALLQAKTELIALMQELQEDMLIGETAEPVITFKRKHRTLKRQAKALAAAKAEEEARKKAAFPMAVTFVERPSPNRVFYRADANSRPGFYRPTQVGTTDSTTLSDMVFIFDPYFMLTHPWYWGAKDGSLRSSLMLMEMMSHQGERQANHDPLFIDRPAYDPAHFNRPIEPVIYGPAAAQPFADPWNPNAPAPTADVTAASMLGWETTTGYGAGRELKPEFTPSTERSTDATNSGWFASGTTSSSANSGETSPSPVLSFERPAPTATDTDTGSAWSATPSAAAATDWTSTPATTTTTTTGWTDTTTTTTTTTGDTTTTTTTTGDTTTTTTTTGDSTTTTTTGDSTTTTGSFD